jgi:acid phosphatase type 7
MDGSRPHGRMAIVVLAAALPACTARPPVEELPTAQETMAAVGKRLSRTLSVGALTALAARRDRVLAALTRAERDALGRGYFRFRVDQPVLVTVAAPVGSIPFWLTDQGFSRTGHVLKTPDTEWAVFRKRFGPGWVGLGVNALDRRAEAHYAVLVRLAQGGAVELQESDREHWRIVTAREGVSAASGVARPLRNLPAELIGATLLQPAHDRRHSTCLATGRIWKTHVASRREPDQVTIAFGSDPTGSLVWTWRTDPTVTKTALRVKAAECTPRVILGNSHLVKSPNLLNDPAIRRHRVSVDGLRPGTEYAYALGDGAPGGWSEWKTVRTAPARPDRFGLLYLGDAQCGLESWGRLLHRAYEHRPDVGAILLAGDLIDRGNERTNWDHFFLRAGDVFEHVPLMPAVGNHEYLDQGPRLYRSIFDLPKNGPPGIDANLVYSFEYGNAFIAVLDSTLAVSDPALARKQAEWLDEALARTSAAWKIVMFHHPVYASHPTRENPSLRDAWVPVFDQHHVDLVLQGHDHAYLRTYPMRAHRRVASAAEGTVYIVSVSGDKYCAQDPRDYTAVGLTQVSTYQTIDVQLPENRLTYAAWDAQGREVDRFVIEKPKVRARSARRRSP